MKYIISSFFLLSCFLICPADSDEFEYKRITKPYTYGITKQYPLLTEVTTAFCVGALIGMCAQYSNTFISSSATAPLIGTYVALLITMFPRCSKQHLLDTLLINPLHALNTIHEANKTFENNFLIQYFTTNPINRDTAYSLFEKFLKEHTTKFPLLFLEKRTQYNRFGTYFPSHEYNKKYHETFETIISSACLKRIGTANNPVTYASFGCGSAFQNFIILIKILTQKPNATLIIHLIDEHHTTYTEFKELLTEPRLIDENKKTDVSQVLSQMSKKLPTDNLLISCEIMDIKNKLISSSLRNNNTLENDLLIGFITVEEKYKQMLSFLKNTFPKASLTIYLHDTHISYEQYRQNNNLEVPDVLNASNIQDEIKMSTPSLVESYASLCARMLTQKPIAFNAWLETTTKSTASIRTLSLNKKNEADEILDIKIQEKPIKIYLQEIHKL